MGSLILNLKPYQDELLYSIIARYHIRTGNKSFTRTHREFFGKVSQQTRNTFLPCDIDNFISNLYFKRYTVDGIIQSHTLYSFYKLLLTESEAWQVRRAMSKVKNDSILEVARVAITEESFFPKYLRFCPVCLHENLNQYGESYWSRLHNTPGICVCLLHSSYLLESSVPVQAKRTEYHTANLETCYVSQGRTLDDQKTLYILSSFAKEVQWIMNNNLSFKGLAWLRKKYQKYLAEKNYLKVSKTEMIDFNHQKLADDFIEYYGANSLNRINPRLNDKPENYLTRCLLACDIEVTIDRVTHLLLMKFLASSIADFLFDA